MAYKWQHLIGIGKNKNFSNNAVRLFFIKLMYILYVKKLKFSVIPIRYNVLPVPTVCAYFWESSVVHNVLSDLGACSGNMDWGPTIFFSEFSNINFVTKLAISSKNALWWTNFYKITVKTKIISWRVCFWKNVMSITQRELRWFKNFSSPWRN